ncbi:hypothetical protein POVCU2_0028370 [Plasmodium ovale curtisi]|uniref:Uncharacterized protein n=1 Tax=Plasmodium ovale curtisi TaxID=864141 RepID=A0A1A8X6R0_PLAOA|nr:hypothetical protein POVCU2_0028370 [Plasmodium ovale curtisi]SBS99465.1 hypothetical protein POVCU1_052930 [Plasmodium ovale curtisi]
MNGHPHGPPHGPPHEHTQDDTLEEKRKIKKRCNYNKAMSATKGCMQDECEWRKKRQSSILCITGMDPVACTSLFQDEPIFDHTGGEGVRGYICANTRSGRTCFASTETILHLPPPNLIFGCFQ